MATVTLTELWIHDATDYTTYVAASLASLQELDTINSQVRRYAGGVQRSITKPGTATSYPVQFDLPARTDIQTLRDLQGDPVLIRDPMGRKFYATYANLNVTEYPLEDINSNAYQVNLTLNEITMTEEV